MGGSTWQAPHERLPCASCVPSLGSSPHDPRAGFLGLPFSSTALPIPQLVHLSKSTVPHINHRLIRACRMHTVGYMTIFLTPSPTHTPQANRFLGSTEQLLEPQALPGPGALLRQAYHKQALQLWPFLRPWPATQLCTVRGQAATWLCPL